MRLARNCCSATSAAYYLQSHFYSFHRRKKLYELYSLWLLIWMLWSKERFSSSSAKNCKLYGTSCMILIMLRLEMKNKSEYKRGSWWFHKILEISDTWSHEIILIYSVVNRLKFDINNIVNVYSLLGVVNLLAIYFTPLFLWEKRLPYLMYVPFEIDQTTVGFCAAYFYQFGNVIYAGGINITVNIYLFAMLVCVSYFLSLLGSRMECLGYPNGSNEHWTAIPKTRKSFYKEICTRIELHLKIDE